MTEQPPPDTSESDPAPDPDPESDRLVRAGAIAAGVGGLAWVVKALHTLLTGDDVLAGLDLGAVFVVVQGLFGLAVVGLHRRLVIVAPEPGPGELDRRRTDPDVPLLEQGRGGTKAAVGRWLGYAAVALAVVAAALIPMPRPLAGTLAGIAAFLLGVSWVVAVGLVGIVVSRRVALPPPAHRVPFWIGLWTIPLLVAFGIVSNLAGDRWLEVPVVAIGLLWIVVGLALWSPVVGRTPQGQRGQRG